VTLKTPVLSLRGVFPSLVTPFDEGGHIIWGDFASLISYELDSGAHGLTALGLGGEASRLSIPERLKVMEAIFSLVPNGTAVIVGVSADDTKSACELARAAAAGGAAALMVAPPNVPGISHPELQSHYRTVCDTTGTTPVMIQDAPAFLKVSLGREFISKLTQACANVCYVKPEAFPAAERTAELVQQFGDRIGVFGGVAGLHFIDVLEAGAIGLIPGCEASGELSAIFEAFEAGKREEAMQRFARLQPLLVFEMQSLDIYLACSKAILKARGIISSDALRAPIPLGAYGRQVLNRHVQRAFGNGCSVEGGSH